MYMITKIKLPAINSKYSPIILLIDFAEVYQDSPSQAPKFRRNSSKKRSVTVMKSGGNRAIEAISQKSLQREMHQSHNDGADQ